MSTGTSCPPEARQRVQDLVIPPAWTNVWITPFPNGHLQAVGVDAAGRKQYLYHPQWRERRDAEKFDRMIEFGTALAKARGTVLEHLGLQGMPLERALAASVRLLDLGYFRIGNDVYADTNGSFGLTTLERRHVRRTRQVLVFSFTGKSGVDHRIEVDDPVVIEALQVMRRRRNDDPRLLAYRETARWRAVLAPLVNDYVREVTGMEATAKDFRTWHATVLAAEALARAERGESAAAQKRAVSSAMKDVAAFLGNMPALARSSYVDPRIVDAYQSGVTIRVTQREFANPGVRQAALDRATLKLLGEA